MDIACVGKFSTKISGGQILQGFIHNDGFSVNSSSSPTVEKVQQKVYR